MSDCDREQSILCAMTGRNCERKLSKLSGDAQSTNDYTAYLLADTAERLRAIVTETSVRIDGMCDRLDEDPSDIDEGPDDRKKLMDEVEFKIAELDAIRPTVAVGCDGARLLGRCGAYLTFTEESLED